LVYDRFASEKLVRIHGMVGRDYNYQDGSSMGGLGAAISRAVGQHRMAERMRPHQAIALWSDAAGERVASVTQAESVRSGVLFVRAKSSVWANELTFYKTEILRKINDQLGGEFIKDVRFLAGNRSERLRAPKSAVKTEIRDIGAVAALNTPVYIADPKAKLIYLAERTRSVLAWKKENGWVACSRCDALYESGQAQPTDSGRTQKHARAGGAANICPVCKTLAQLC
jgi:hypothetical protein